MRAIALPARLRRRRQEATRPAIAEKLLAAPVATPVMKTRPYSDALAVSQVAAYRIAAMSEFYFPQPGFEAAPGRAPETAPMQALPDNVKVPPPPPARAPVTPGAAPADTLAMPEVLTLRRIRDGLQGLDWNALDAARAQEGATHAGVRAARGRAPIGEFMDRAFVHPALRHPHRGELNCDRVNALAYPPCDVTAPDHAAAYVTLMRQLDRITGTQGRNWWTLPAIAAGGAA
jgi:hypothetical protein